MKYFGGVEGGGSNTLVVIINENGEIISREHGGGSNGWLLGIDAAATLLISLITKAKQAAGIDEATPLESCGLCMSGFLQPRMQEGLRAAFQSRAPLLSNFYYIDNDSPGSVYTASGPDGGVVIIAGTGSMSQVILPPSQSSSEAESPSSFTSGGWGHMIGDEGSAYFIASRVITGVFRALDNYAEHSTEPRAIPDVKKAHDLMLEYFGISDKDGMLDVFYKHFDKAKIAGFTKALAEAATNTRDEFCREAFYSAGIHLGSMARTLAPRLRQKSSKNGDVDNVAIVCVGSVWKSWPLLSQGFIEAATAPFADVFGSGHIKSFRLLQLTETSAVGAAWKGAQLIKHDLPLKFSTFTRTLFEYENIH
jgi:N-acetylglucosamine kinase